MIVGRIGQIGSFHLKLVGPIGCRDLPLKGLFALFLSKAYQYSVPASE